MSQRLYQQPTLHSSLFPIVHSFPQSPKEYGTRVTRNGWTDATACHEPKKQFHGCVPVSCEQLLSPRPSLCIFFSFPLPLSLLRGAHKFLSSALFVCLCCPLPSSIFVPSLPYLCLCTVFMSFGIPLKFIFNVCV